MEGIVKKENKISRKLVKIFGVFIIGSIVGYLLEMIVGLVQNGYFVSKQGLIYGPFSQVYGIGLVIYYLLIPNNKKNLEIFLISMILGGVVEYIFSYLQETFFGTISWDYSNLLFNINGRTSLLHCIYWGIGGILFSKYIRKYIRPQIEKIDLLYPKMWFKVLIIFLAIFLLFDIIISSLACKRQEERKEGIEPKNNIEIFLDKTYTDEVLNEIYSNAKEI